MLIIPPGAPAGCPDPTPDAEGPAPLTAAETWDVRFTPYVPDPDVGRVPSLDDLDAAITAATGALAAVFDVDGARLFEHVPSVGAELMREPLAPGEPSAHMACVFTGLRFTATARAGVPVVVDQSLPWVVHPALAECGPAAVAEVIRASVARELADGVGGALDELRCKVEAARALAAQVAGAEAPGPAAG